MAIFRTTEEGSLGRYGEDAAASIAKKLALDPRHGGDLGALYSALDKRLRVLEAGPWYKGLGVLDQRLKRVEALAGAFQTNIGALKAQLGQVAQIAQTAVAQVRAMVGGDRGPATFTPNEPPQVAYPADVNASDQVPQATDATPQAEDQSQAINDFSWAYRDYDED